MATFTFSFTYPDDKVLEFAQFLNYPETVDEYSTDEEGNRTRTEVPNPQSPNDFLQEKASEHINLFTTQYAEHRKRQDMMESSKSISEAYDQGVISDIKNSLISSVA